MPGRTKLHLLLLSLVMTIGLAALAPATGAQVAFARTQAGSPHAIGHPLTTGPVTLPTLVSRPQGHVGLPSARPASMRPAAAPIASPTIDLKLLVLAADGTEPSLTAIKQALNYLGTPYSVWIAAQHPNQLIASKLSFGPHGYYQGIMLTTGDLNYSTDGGLTYHSALSAAEWQVLWDYESAFGVRQATWYTSPIVDYGYTFPVTATPGPTLVTLTAAGQTIFPYINATNPITISGAYTYLAPVLTPAAPGTTNTVLLTDASNHALSILHTYPDGRENLSMTFDGAYFLVHSIAFSYGIINWVTKGLHLGELHTYIGAQVDDLFLPDEIWGKNPATQQYPACGSDPETTGVTFRLAAVDIQKLVAWQNKMQTQPTSQNVKLDMAFNGSGAFGEDLPNNDDLVPAIQANISKFKWISHTWDHLLLNEATYISSTQEIALNNDAAVQLNLAPYSTLNMVTPEISGLYNPEYLRAAHDQGIRFLVSDTSKPVASFVYSNTGTYNSFQPSIFMIPRRPNNLFYNVSLPDEWAAEYNCLYKDKYFGGVTQTYADILNRESDVLLTYLLMGERYPWMFHQPNLRAYDAAGHSLISDLIDRTLAKYNRIYKLPIESPTQDALGRLVADRTNYAQTALGSTPINLAATQNFVADIVPGQSITLQSTQAITIPVTGLPMPGAEQYAGQKIATYAIGANQTVTFSLVTGQLVPVVPPPPPVRFLFLPVSRGN